MVLGLALTSLAELAKAFAPGETGDHHRLASARIPTFLDLDLQARTIRSVGIESRTPGFGAPDGGSQSLVGRTTDSWRITETGDRSLGAHRLPTDAQAPEAAFPNLEGLPEQRERYVMRILLPSGGV